MSTNPAIVHGRPDQTRHALILAVLAIAGTTFALLQAIVVPALPTIAHALGTSSSGAAWILTVNLLSTAVLTPILGRAGDILGKERVLSAVMVALAGGTLVCALAPSLPVMLLGRAIQGAGGAVYPLAFGIVRDQFPRERIAGAIGLVSSLLGIGAGLGLIVPGFILQGLSYHWLFWLPLAVIAVTTPLTIVCVPRSPVRNAASINWGSAALMATGLAGLLVAVSEATAWGWGSTKTVGLFAGAAALVAIWVRRELRSREPLVDMRMMATRAVWTTNLAAFLLGVGMYASIAVIPALVELPRSSGVGFGGTAIAAGLFMLPTAAMQLLIGPYTGRIERRLGSRTQLAGGDGLRAGCVRGAVRRARHHARVAGGDGRARTRARARAELARQPDRRCGPPGPDRGRDRRQHRDADPRRRVRRADRDDLHHRLGPPRPADRPGVHARVRRVRRRADRRIGERR